VEAAVAAGARFGVSSGATDRLLAACAKHGLPILTGAATATEAMVLLELGYTVQTFFPTEADGGPPALAAIGAPLPQITFCPTGGITAATAPDYLRLSNTLCVGGSWVAPKDKVAAADWAGIEELTRTAAALSH